MSSIKKIYIALFALILLTPLGLITENPAWGEWDEEELKAMIGFVPTGIKEGGWYSAPFADYGFVGFGAVGGYILSAVVGTVLVAGVFFTLRKLK